MLNQVAISWLRAPLVHLASHLSLYTLQLGQDNQNRLGKMWRSVWHFVSYSESRYCSVRMTYQLTVCSCWFISLSCLFRGIIDLYSWYLANCVRHKLVSRTLVPFARWATEHFLISNCYFHSLTTWVKSGSIFLKNKPCQCHHTGSSIVKGKTFYY